MWQGTYAGGTGRTPPTSPEPPDHPDEAMAGIHTNKDAPEGGVDTIANDEFMEDDPEAFANEYIMGAFATFVETVELIENDFGMDVRDIPYLFDMDNLEAMPDINYEEKYKDIPLFGFPDKPRVISSLSESFYLPQDSDLCLKT